MRRANLEPYRDRSGKSGVAGYRLGPDFIVVAFKTGGGNNTGNYSNPELDKLIDQILSELDKEKRTVLIRKAEDILDDESPWVGNGFNGHGLFWRNTLKGMGNEHRVITETYAGFETGWFDK